MNRKPRPAPRTSYFMQGFLPALLYSTETELDDLGAYLLSVSEFLDRQAASFRERLERTSKEHGWNEEAQDHYFQMYGDELDRWTDGFPSTIRSTVLLAACSRLEEGLTSLCKHLEQHEDVATPTTWDSLRMDRGLKRSAKFLRRNFEIHPEDHSAWAETLDHFQVRHCYAHANGNVRLMKAEQATKLREAVGRLSGVTIDDVEQIQLDTTYPEAVVRLMKQFWGAIEDALADNGPVGPTFWP